MLQLVSPRAGYNTELNNPNYRRYLKEVEAHPLLTVEEEQTLPARIRAGDPAALERLINGNLRLVVKIANSYANLGVPVLDLISSGNIGLHKAAKRFEPKKGKLSNYAAWWIKKFIKKTLTEQSRTIRLPRHIVGQLSELWKVEQRIELRYGRPAKNTEIALHLQITPEKVQELKSYAQRTSSTDAPIDEDSDSTQGALLSDLSITLPSNEVSRSDDFKRLLTCMQGVLNSREQTVLIERFGLHDKEELTLEQIGERFSITRERVRQIESEALKKLRNALKRSGQVTADKQQRYIA